MSKFYSPKLCAYCPHFRHDDITNQPMCSLSGIWLPSAFAEGCGIDLVATGKRKKK